MKIKGLNECDFVNYKKTSMYIIFPFCTLKCDKENGCNYCQNSPIMREPDIDISVESLANRYISNPLSHAIVCAGLEPFDTFDDLLELVKELRKVTEDDIVIYTGFNKDEITEECKSLSAYKNIIIKFGRYRPNQEKHFDEVLGVYLASDNQYAEKIS